MKEEIKKQGDPLRDKTMAFSIRMINLKHFLEQKKEYILSNQILGLVQIQAQWLEKPPMPKAVWILSINFRLPKKK